MRHDQLEQRLRGASLDVGAAEAHGTLCGLLCGGARDTERRWVTELLQDADPADLLARECGDELRRLAEETRADMEGPGLGFTPVLPDDALPMEQRTEALRDWCQGFLYGVGLAGVRHDGLSTDAAEALQDIADIAQLDTAPGDDPEEDEQSYTEVTEFLWVAAMLIHAECVGEGHDDAQ